MTRMKQSLFTIMVLSCLLIFAAYQLDTDGNWTKYLDADNKSLVTEYMDRCDNVTFLGERSLEFSWQPVVQNQSFVYSGHIDNRGGRRMIKLFVILENKTVTNTNYSCYIWYKHKTCPIVTAATPTTKLGYRNHRYNFVLWTCLPPANVGMY